MRALILLLALTGCAAASSMDDNSESRALARDLESKVAGEPRDCVNRFGGTALHAVDRRTLVYDAPGDLWVNRLEASCPGLHPGTTIVIESYGNRFCRNDRIRALEPGSAIPGPICLLGRFTPYRDRR